MDITWETCFKLYPRSFLTDYIGLVLVHAFFDDMIFLGCHLNLIRLDEYTKLYYHKLKIRIFKENSLYLLK